MKEKRYFCDWMSKGDDNRARRVAVIFVILIMLVTICICFVFYTKIRPNQEELEDYFETNYKYLNEIADKVIREKKFDISAIPKEVTEYEITYKDGKITFSYSINRGKIDHFYIVPNISMTIKFTKDFEVLEKIPSYSSIEEFTRICKIECLILVLFFGAGTFTLIGVIIVNMLRFAYEISKYNKKKDSLS